MEKKGFDGLYIAAAALLVGLGSQTANAANGVTGNGSPNGAHYNLNIIGVAKNKIADLTDSNRHTIFVTLDGKSTIWLCEAGVDVGCTNVTDFAVIDGNGTDSNGATFALPNPDPDHDGSTVYSVFARALGKPGGSSVTTTCATGPGLDGVLGTADDELVCSLIQLELQRDAGKSKFDNVTKYLLYIYADIDGDGDLERVSLFDDSLRGYFWDYDNKGLKLAQFRFYECATVVPDPTDPNGAQLDTDCFGGSH